nr:hypothetical protein [Tanacetum cinerariifolium]
MDFVFSSNNNSSSTNRAVNTTQAVNTARGISTASTQVNATYSTNIDNLSDAVIYSFFSSQSNRPQLVHEDLEQIHSDDMEEMDLIWQMAILNMRARRECRTPRNQDNKHKKSSIRCVPVETSTSTTLVSCDGLGGYDWSDQAEEGPNYALMDFSSSIPLPYIRNFMPPTPDLSFTGLDEFVNKPVVKNCKAKSREEEPKVRERFFGKVTPLFQTIVIQNQSELGEGSLMPTDPHHTPIIIQSSSSQPQQIQKPSKPTRKDTQVPQPSGHTKSVTDEVVHKELGDSLVRAATTASSLEAEQDSVLDLEKTKATQQNEIATQQQEIASLKRMVKKLEKKIRSRTHKLKRLYKVSLSARVETSDNKESLGEDASKQEKRIDAIDADEYITLVNDDDNEMFDVDTLVGEEMFVVGQNENVIEEVVDAAQVRTAATIVTITTKEITLAQALEALKTSKPKVKGIIFQEQGKSTTTTTISSQQSQDKGKRIMIEESMKPKKKDQIRLDEKAAKKLQAEFDEEERLAKKS